MPNGAQTEKATVPLRQWLDTWDNEGRETNVEKPFDKLPYAYGVLPILRYLTPKQQLDTRTIKEERLRSSSTSESCHMATVINHIKQEVSEMHMFCLLRFGEHRHSLSFFFSLSYLLQPLPSASIRFPTCSPHLPLYHCTRIISIISPRSGAVAGLLLLAGGLDYVTASFALGTSVLVQERANPIKAPGKVSGHVHTIMGGSDFGTGKFACVLRGSFWTITAETPTSTCCLSPLDITYESLIASECTSTGVVEDKG